MCNKMDNKKNILWIDNDLNTEKLLNWQKELSNDYNIIEMIEPECFLEYISSEENDPVCTRCIILDISFREQHSGKLKGKYGSAVGEYLINQLKSEKCRYKHVPTIVFTITGDNTIKKLCDKHSIKIIKKRDGSMLLKSINDLLK